MSFTSFSFLIFIIPVVAVYYILPLKFRWLALLAGSIAFYVINEGIGFSVIILTTALISWGFGLWIEKYSNESAAKVKEAASSEEKKAIRAKYTVIKRWILAAVLVLDFSLLVFFKYDSALGTVFSRALEKFIRIFNGNKYQCLSNLGIPLGISFYTFQTVSYLIDVYRTKQKAEKNPLKFTLFVTFFPQIVQGPISRYSQLSPQLIQGNRLNFDNLKKGVILIGYGFVQKLLFSNRLSVFVDQVYTNYSSYGGAVLFLASILYGLQIYTDFAGGMSITYGVAQLVGVEMTENFKQPYLAVSISDFWRRWHITLGSWMRDYLFYPLSLSKPFARLGKWSRAKFGNRWSKIFVSSIVSCIVFTVVGIWHGPELKFVVYGFYNGLLVMLATLCEPLFEKIFHVTRIDPKSKVWHVIQIIRTFILVSVGRSIVRSVSLSAAGYAFGKFFTDLRLSEISSVTASCYTQYELFIMLAVLLVIIAVDLIQEYKCNTYDWLQKRHIVIRWIVYLAIIVALVLFIPITEFKGDFIYEKF